LVSSVRDWGRSCWCEPGRNNTCGKRYEWQEGTLPYGYDHKGICRTLGFNLKGTEIGAACGLSQAGRLAGIVSKRRSNFAFLLNAVDRLRDACVLPTFSDEASPFGFPITLRETGTRRDMQAWLTQEGVDSRTLFSGNLTRHPYMQGREWLQASTLEQTDRVMESTFWVGCHPELSEEQLAYSAQKISEFLGVFD
jgi:CDP-6-deoxy-D-xylo-4-hexulose-3-dehydrase